MPMTDVDVHGLDDLEKELMEYAKKASPESVLDTMEKGAKEFVKDLLMLPKPRREIAKAGYTHLIDSFKYKRTDKDIEVGWGKYYGRMVEEGTRKMKSNHHLKPLWEKNKEKYYRIMTKDILD